MNSLDNSIKHTSNIRIKDSYKKLSILELPIFCVFIAGYSIWVVAILLRLLWNVPFYITLPISILGVYLLFHVIHDAIHGSVSNSQFINNLLGNIGFIPFYFAPFDTFKYLHLQHHSNLNIPHSDPDYNTSGKFCCNNAFMGIFFHTFYYYYYFFRNTIYSIKNYNKLITWSVLIITIHACITIHAIQNSYINDVLVLWIIPAFLSTIILTYLFDYIPHRDHSISIKNNKYKATHMTQGIFSRNPNTKLLSILTLNQLTYHNIHHLWPKIPFDRYPLIWNEYRSELIKRETPLQTIFNNT